MMENNKRLIILICLIAVLTTTLTIIIMKNNKKDDSSEEVEELEKFNLSDKYYNAGEFILVDDSGIKVRKKDNYILYTYNNFCIFTIPCEDIFKEVMTKYNIDVISITFEDFKKTDFYKEVKLAPSILIIENGKIVSYLRADSDEDFNRYQDAEEFEKWLDGYVYLEKGANE